MITPMVLSERSRGDNPPGYLVRGDNTLGGDNPQDTQWKVIILSKGVIIAQGTQWEVINLSVVLTPHATEWEVIILNRGNNPPGYSVTNLLRG